MTKTRSLSTSEMDQGMEWIRANLTSFVSKENAEYWYSRCLERVGGLLSVHTRKTDERCHHWFRARAEESFSEGDHFRQECFLHPPSEYAVGGRANIPGVPVLYVSESLDDALLETGLLKSGKEARLVILEFNGKLNLDQFYFPKDLTNINRRVAERINDYFEPFSRLMNGYHEEAKERAFHLHRLISNTFLDESHFFSSLISYIRMYAHKASDGVIYPGVKSLQMLNWALTIDVSQKCTVYRGFKLKCHRTVKMKF